MALLKRWLADRGVTATLVRVASGSAALQFVNLGVGLITGMALSRLLGVEGLGQYGLAMATASFLGIGVEAGMSQLILRDAARENGPTTATPAALQEAAVSAVAIAAVCLAGISVYAVTTDTPAKSIFASLIFCLVVALSNIAVAPILGAQRVVAGQVPSLVIRPLAFLSLLGASSLALPKLSATAAMTFQVLAGTLALGFALVQLRSFTTSAGPLREPQKSEIHTRGRLWLKSLPIAASEAARIIQGNAAIATLGGLATAEAVGLFRVASSTWTMVMLPLTLFNGATGPLLARLHAEGDRKKTQTALWQIALGMTVGVAGLSMPIFLSGDWLLEFLFGPGFGRAAPELKVLCLGAVFNAFFGPNTTMLTMAGRERVVARAFAVSVAVLLLSLGPLIVAFGSLGAAVASSASMLTWNIIIWVDARVSLNLDTSLLGFFDGRLRASPG